MRLYVCIFLLLVATVAAGNDKIYIAFCGNGFTGDEWVNQFKKTFDNTIVVFERDTQCEDVKDRHVAVGIRDTTSSPYDVIIRKERMSIPGYINSILKKLSDRRITNVNIDNALKKVKEENGKETFVAYVARANSIEHQLFQQSILSPTLPNNVNIYLTHNEYTLPQDIQPTISRSLHVWLVRDGQWSALTLPDGSPTVQEIRDNMQGVLKILGYPPIYEYQGDNYEEVYEGSELRYILVFHTTDQTDEAYRKIIKPIVDIVRPHFAFIVVDVDEYPEMLSEHHVPDNNLPYIVTRQHGQKSGVHIDKKYIPYNKDSLVGLFKSMVDPKVNNVDSPQKQQQAIISITNTDVSTIKVLLKKEKNLFIATFCKKGSQACNKMYKKMQRASDAISRGEFKMSMFVVECVNVEEATQAFQIKELPQVLIMGNNEWEPFNKPTDKEYTVANFIKMIEKYAVNVNNDAAPTLAQPSENTNHENYFPQSSVDEDEAFSVLYHNELSLAKEFNHLTSDNYHEVMDNTGLVVFYVKYCVQCKSLFNTVFAVAEPLAEGNLPVSLVNCGDYPDVCEHFDVYSYPSIKYRLPGGEWTVYKGVVSDDQLLKLVEPERPDKHPIKELTPSLLIEIYNSVGLDSLAIFCSPSLSSHHLNILSDIKSIYWLNSTQYSTIAEGLVCGNRPTIVYANYVEKTQYRTEVSESTTADEVREFVEKASQGLRQPMGVIDSPPWNPINPPIQFPSKSFQNREKAKQRKDRRGPDGSRRMHPDNHEGAPPEGHERVPPEGHGRVPPDGYGPPPHNVESERLFDRQNKDQAPPNKPRPHKYHSHQEL